MSSFTIDVRTPAAPGAVAVIALTGDVDAVLTHCSPPTSCPLGELHLANVAEIDTLLAARPTADQLVLMPHGGPAIVRAIVHWLETLGGRHATDTPWPDVDHAEQCMLRCLPLANTTAGLDLLLAQPERWRACTEWTQDDIDRSARLDRMLSPPTIALIGPPNIGKSTLLNALAGRRAATVHDAPGTTRDHVGALLELGPFTVSWIDTPGLRTTDDPVEAQAIELARAPALRADLLLLGADATCDWPDVEHPCTRRVGLRHDAHPRDDADITCAAAQGDGLEALVALIVETLVPEADRSSERPWGMLGQSPIAE